MLSVLGIGVGAVFIAAVFMALIVDRRGARARHEYGSVSHSWLNEHRLTEHERR